MRNTATKFSQINKKTMLVASLLTMLASIAETPAKASSEAYKDTETIHIATESHTGMNFPAAKRQSGKNRELCFWSNFNFSDTTRQSCIKAEKEFIKFAKHTRKMHPADVAKQMNSLVNTIFDNKDERKLRHYTKTFTDIAERTIGNTKSKLYDIVSYELFRETLASIQYAHTAARYGNTSMAKSVLKNMPGTHIGNIACMGRQGKTVALSYMSAKYTVLFFYDPDCHICHDIAKQLASHDIMTNDSDIAIVAIYPDIDTERWLAHRQAFPPNWTDVCSVNGEIAEKEIFHLPVLPAIYLLDNDNFVILKDCKPETLIGVLHQLKTRDY